MAKLRNHTTLTKSPSKKAERWEVWRGWVVPNDHEESDIAGWSKRRRETDERTQRTVEAGRSVMTEKELYLCSLLHQCTSLEDQAGFKQASLAECFLPKPAPRPNKKPSPASDPQHDAAGQPEEANGASEDKKENGEEGPHITEGNQLPSRAHRAKTAVLSSGDAPENERMPRCYSAGGCVHYKDGLGKNGYRDVSSATARAKRFIALSHSNSRASSSLRRREEDQGEEEQGEDDIEITLDEDEDSVCKDCGCQQSDASQTTGNRTNRDTSPARCMAPPPAFRLSYSQSNITLQNPYTDPDPHVIDHDEDGADEGPGNTHQGTLLYKENGKGFNIRDSYLDSSGLIVSSLSELRKLAPPRSEQYTPRSQIYQVQESVDTKHGKSSGEANNTTTDNSPQQTSSDSDDTKHNDKPSAEPAVCKCARSSEAKKEPAKKQVSLVLKKVSLQDAGEQQMTTVTSPMPVKFPNRTVSNQNTPQRGSNSSPQKTPETIDPGSKHGAQGPQKTPETIDPGSKHTAQDPEQSGQTVNHRIAILNAEVLPSNAPLVGSSTLTHSNSAPSLGGGHPTELGSSRGTGLGAGHPMELGSSRGTGLGAVYSLQGLTPGLSAAMMTSSLVDLLPAVENNIRTRMVYRMDKNLEDGEEIYALDQDSLDRGLLVSRDNLVIRDNLISRELSRTLRSLDNQDQQLYTRDLSQEDNMYLLQDGLESTRARDKHHAMLGPPAFRPQQNKTSLHRAKENSSKRIYSQFNYNNNNMMYSESRWQSSGGNLYQVAPGSRPVLNHLVEEVKSAPASYSWDQAVFPVTQQPATSNTPQPYTDKAAESSVNRLYKELPTNRDISRNKSTPQKQTGQGLAKLTLRGSCIEPSATHSNPDLDLVPPDPAVVKSVRQTAASDVTCTQVSYNTYIVETTEARRIRISEHGDSYRDQQPTTWTPTTPHLPSSNKGKFLANIQELYHQESESMLDFIRRSRNSLRDTASEIKDEQEVLQETFRKLSQDRAKSRLDVGHNPAPRRERSNVSTRSYPPHAQTHKPYCPSPEPAISYPGYSRPTDPRYPPATDPRHPVHADPRYPAADPRFPAQDPRYPVLADPRFPPVINPGYPKSASRLPPLAKTTMHYENEEFNDADDDEYFKEETEEIMRATSRAHDVHELERARQKERVEKLKEQRKQKQEERAEVAQELIREASNLEKQKDEQKKRQEEKLKERIREMKKHKSMTGLGGDRSLSSLGGDLSVTGLGGDLARSASRGTLPDVDVDTDIIRTPRPRSPATLDTSPADDNIVINHLPGADAEPEPTETETEDPKERKRREKKERKEKKEKDKKEKKEKKKKSREKELEEIAM